MTEKEIMFYIDLTFEELYSIMFAENNNIDELLISFQFTVDRLIMCMMALRDKLNESEI